MWKSFVYVFSVDPSLSLSRSAMLYTAILQYSTVYWRILKVQRLSLKGGKLSRLDVGGLCRPGADQPADETDGPNLGKRGLSSLLPSLPPSFPVTWTDDSSFVRSFFLSLSLSTEALFFLHSFVQYKGTRVWMHGCLYISLPARSIALLDDDVNGEESVAEAIIPRLFNLALKPF